MDAQLKEAIEFFGTLLGGSLLGGTAIKKGMKKSATVEVESCYENCKDIFITQNQANKEFVRREEFTMSAAELSEKISTIRQELQTERRFARNDTQRIYDKLDELTATLLNFISLHTK